MVDVVKNNLDKIIDACKLHHVKSLYLFGSAAKAVDFTEKSDIDLLYKIDLESFNNPFNGSYDYIDNLDDLQKKLAAALQRNIDLVPEDDVMNPFLKETINRSKRLLYAKGAA